jgi:cytochrome c-type biogenesis protein CcmH
MIFWVILAGVVALASLSMLTPLYRIRQNESRLAEQEVSVYRDQLREIERDVERGVIAASEAEAARTEIARRLIKADASKSEAAPESAAKRPRQIAALAVVVGIPLVAVGLYLFVGSPNLPDEPLEARLTAPPEESDTAALIARVEGYLATHPDDGQGWAVLAPVYVSLGRYDDAVKAYHNAVRLLGSTAEREAALGEAIVQANQGVVTKEAEAAFRRAEALDGSLIRPRFYMALAFGQQGHTQEAIEALQALLAEAPSGAPWIGPVQAALTRLQSIASAAPGPTSGDAEAAANLAPQDRLAMIEGMVARLADRLKTQPDDAEGWARLVRSYMVLGRTDDARTALDDARVALAGDPDKLATVESEAKAAGLKDGPGQ